MCVCVCTLYVCVCVCVHCMCVCVHCMCVCVCTCVHVCVRMSVCVYWFVCYCVSHSIPMKGHSDVTMGIVCTSDDELAKKMRFLQMGTLNYMQP